MISLTTEPIWFSILENFCFLEIFFFILSLGIVLFSGVFYAALLFWVFEISL